MGKIVLIIISCILCILTAIISFRYWNFDRTVKNQVQTFSIPPNNTTTIVTAEMLQKLPSPVARYLTYSRVVGKPIPQIVRLRQTGRIKQSPDASWMNFEADEYYAIHPPSFLWKASLPSYKIPFVFGLDRYNDAKGKMTINMLSLIPIVDAQGDEIDQGAMMRYLNEMMWFPAAFLGENISWKEIDDSSAEVTLTNSGKKATATLHFDAEGKLINFVAKRYMTVGKNYQLETWSTPLSEYGEFEGIRLPIKGRAIWKLTTGDFEYIQLEIESVQYE